MEIADTLSNLKHLRIQDSVCRAYEVDVVDLRLMVVLIQTLRDLQPKKADKKDEGTGE